MSHQIAGYEMLAPFGQFSWHRFSGQVDRGVTYIYLATPPISRVRGQSPVLYVGKTELPIAKRVQDETKSRNTPGNTQNTNIRLSVVVEELRRTGYAIDTYFTHGLAFTPSTHDREAMLAILEVWDKRCWVEFAQSGSALLPVPIEKFLLCHYAAIHLELPPMNNSM